MWRQSTRRLINLGRRSAKGRDAIAGMGSTQIKTVMTKIPGTEWKSGGCIALMGVAASIALAPIAFAGSIEEKSFIMIKPDGVNRGLIAEIIKRFEAKGYKLVAIKVLVPSEDTAKQHYAEHDGKPFFPGLVKFLTSGPVIAMVWEGKEVIKTGRSIIGATNPLASAPGTIRGDFGIEVGRNIIHGSDGLESAQKEIALWFRPEELAQYEKATKGWTYESAI